MIFQHKDTLHYRLIVAGEVVEGELDIERGFGGDEGALVYVLNIDRPEAEQAFFATLETAAQGRTLLLITHASGLEGRFDRVLRLERGRLSEMSR